MKIQSSPSVLLFVLMTGASSTTNAFVPSPSTSLSTSTFVKRGTPKSTAITNQGPSSSLTMRPASVRPPSDLQMNLIDRFIRVAKGNISGVLNSLEAPEKIMNQAMVDMQNDLVKVRQSYAEITAASRRLERQRDAAAQRGQDWYNRAQLALRSGNDTLAKEALYRRQQYLEQVRAIQLQLDTQGKAADKLYQGMQALEVKIQEASQRKNEFIARAKAAESTQKVNDMLSGLTGKTSMDAFRRMEEKVEALEAAAEASAEMASMSTTYLPDGDVSLESEFLLLENSAAVDDEFNKLKTKLLSGSTTSTESRPSKTYTYSESVESDFEKLKKDVQKVPVTVKWD